MNGIIIVIRILSIDYFEYNYLINISKLIKNEKEEVNTIKNNYLNDNKLENGFENTIRIGLFDTLKSNRLDKMNTISKKTINEESSKSKENINRFNNILKNNKENQGNTCDRNFNSKNNLNKPTNKKDTMNNDIKNINKRNLNREESEFSITPIFSTNNINMNANTLEHLNKQSNKANPKLVKNNFINTLEKHNDENEENNKTSSPIKLKSSIKYKKNVDSTDNTRKENLFNSKKNLNENIKKINANSNTLDINISKMKLFECHSQDIIQYNITGSVCSYIIYRLSYIFCCFSQLIKKRAVINNIKHKVFEFLSIQREIRYKL